MRALVQRVNYAYLTCETYQTSINNGVIIFLGIKETDLEEDYQFILRKIKNMRIFSDDAGKINLNLSQVNGEILLVSQFSLYGSVKKNNRPSFTNSANPEKALVYYERLITDLSKDFIVKKGVFGGHMHINYLNDGPFTLMIDSEEI